jgi:thioesterase domain-containing protein
MREPARTTTPHARASELEVERYLAEHIPLARALGATVDRYDARELRLRAPLRPNLNHRHTAFGGSLSALAILAGWARVSFDLRAEGVSAHVVVQRSSVDFDAPVESDFEARIEASDETSWTTFRRTLARRRKARITVLGALFAAGEPVARFEARYVALSVEPDPSSRPRSNR